VELLRGVSVERVKLVAGHRGQNSSLKDTKSVSGYLFIAQRSVITTSFP